MWDLSNLFVDYLQLTDTNDGRWPERAKNLVYEYDVSDPKNIHETNTSRRTTAMPITNSSDAKLYLKITKSMLFIKGNPSKFGRHESLFGYSYEECLDLINNMLGTLGLAPLNQPKVTTIDITLNVRCGNEQQLALFIAAARKARLPYRLTTRPMGTGVHYINKSSYLKIYRKHEELRYNNKHKTGTDMERFEAFNHVEDIAKHCQEHGVARVELRLFSRWLKNQGMRDAYNISTSGLASIYREFVQYIPQRCGGHSMKKLDKNELPLYLAWKDNLDPNDFWHRHTVSKHRKAILEKTDGVIDITNDTVTYEMRQQLDQFITEALPIPKGYVIDKIQRQFEYQEEITEE